MLGYKSTTKTMKKRQTILLVRLFFFLNKTGKIKDTIFSPAI